jgi:hypothetical protein
VLAAVLELGHRVGELELQFRGAVLRDCPAGRPACAVLADPGGKDGQAGNGGEAGCGCQDDAGDLQRLDQEPANGVRGGPCVPPPLWRGGCCGRLPRVPWQPRPSSTSQRWRRRGPAR